VASHYGTAMTPEHLFPQATALVVGAVGIIPDYVPEWFGVSFSRQPWSSRLLFVGYALLVINMVMYCLVTRPARAGLGLVLAAALILPNVAARGMLAIRYSDMLVLGLVVVLSAAPLLGWAAPARRFWLALAAGLLFFSVAAAHEAMTWYSSFHHLAKAALSARAVREAVARTPVAMRDRDIMLMSGFFNHDEMWTFNATPSRLGSFFSANFDIDRGRVRRFSPGLLTERPTVLVDYYYELDRSSIRVTGQVAEVRMLEAPPPVHWQNGAAFPCQGGDVLAIAGRRPAADRSNTRQHIRIGFDRGDRSAFALLEAFGDYQDVRRGERADDSQMYVLVPPGTHRCRVGADGLAGDSAITGVQRLAARP
jgi:hypothetical protein